MINLTTDIQQITAALTYKIDGINKELNRLAENPIEGGDFLVSTLEQSRSQAEELLDRIEKYTDEGQYNLILVDDDELDIICDRIEGMD